MTFFPDWPRSAAATFAAAVLAAAVALVSVVTTVIDGAVSRRRASEAAHREQWWDRWSFTVDRALSVDPAQRRIGSTLLRVLVETPSATSDDRRMANAVAEALRDRRTPEPEETSDGH